MKKITEDYISFFNSRNLDKTMEMFHEDAILIDPTNVYEGTNEIEKEVKRIFHSCTNLSFSAKNIFYDGATSISVIEFSLLLDSTSLRGVEIIQWDGGKILKLTAYVN